MYLDQQRIELLSGVHSLDPAYVYPFIEKVARKCYKSEHNICEGSDKKLIQLLLKRKHYAMLEHHHITIGFVTDRALANELVRHRIAAYAQESTRYVSYLKAGGVGFIRPSNLPREAEELWHFSCVCAESTYINMIQRGASPQQARSVLPLCTRTELVATYNIREWIHVLNMRTAPDAHPDLQTIMKDVACYLHDCLPEIFGKETLTFFGAKTVEAAIADAKHYKGLLAFAVELLKNGEPTSSVLEFVSEAEAALKE